MAVGVLAAAAGTSAATHRTQADNGNVVFLSTQLNAITETEGFKNQIVKGFSGSVDKVEIPLGNATFFPDRIKAESDAGKGTVSLLGGVHGDFPTITQYLIDLSDVAKDLQKAGIPAELFTLGKLGTNKQYYIPWMQASYVMVANKKALSDLPKGADINHLSYGQLFQWAKKHAGALRQPELGFPAGPTGLFPRFLEGYLIPAFTGHLNTSFKSKWAVSGWLYMQQLWKYVHPQSLTYNFMQDPLQSGEVMVAWDHVARITSAVRDHPNDYVVFPAPAGPKGRAYLPVLAGLADPEDGAERRGREGADRVPRRRRAAGTAAAGCRLLPGRRGAALEAGRPGAAGDRSRDQDAAAVEGRAGLAPARRPRRVRAATTTASSPTRSCGSWSTRRTSTRCWTTRARSSRTCSTRRPRRAGSRTR